MFSSEYQSVIEIDGVQENFFLERKTNKVTGWPIKNFTYYHELLVRFQLIHYSRIECSVAKPTGPTEQYEACRLYSTTLN